MALLNPAKSINRSPLRHVVAEKKKGRTMNRLTQSKNTTILPLLIALTLGCFGLSPQARAVDPPPDGGYPNQNAAEGEDASFSLTTGADNTAMGFDALDSNTTGSDNDPARGIWRATGRLNTARFVHTATLLQNGMVLVAGGIGQTDVPASAELYDPASRTWTATGSLNTARFCHTTTLLQNGMVLVAGGLDSDRLFPRAPNCTTRRAGPGLPQAVSTPHVVITRRRCYKTAWSLLQGELTQTPVLASAELYDPASGTWTATGSLNIARDCSHGDVATKRHGPCCRGS